jgi:aspartyl protease family protein
MGHVRVKIRIANPARRQEAVEVDDALVDTGATWSVMPRSLAYRLGLDIIGQKRLRTAEGEAQLDHSFAYIEYNGHDSVGDVVISDSYPGVLVSVLTLEGMALAVDPKTGRLVDSELLLL